MTRAREISNVLGRNIESTTFTATAGQTAFSITHAAGRIQVYMNGLLLDPTVDWTSDGSTVTLTEGAVAGDELEVVKFDNLAVADVVPATGGTFTGNVGINKGTRTLDIKLADTPVSGEYGVQFTAGSGDYLGFGAGGSGTAIAIDSSNRVTMPNLPSWSLRPNFTNNVEHSGNNIQNFSVNGSGDPFAVGVTVSNGRVTVPVAGKYYVCSSWRQEDEQTDFQLAIHVNGVQIARSGIWYSSQRYENCHVYRVLNLSANDYIEIKLSFTGTHRGSNDVLTFFEGFLIG